ncbi:hypothetical protein [Acinetobacter courvalinii]|uniref:hypothetical protein n=1 Tax=Acinetobacter courvalinii TaxID=280147 RepID=UPI00190299BF|nr:hypothetical protein [Acinetobacter courvalinii]MBJ9958412.1 hypothetical protein [Acinetobacter courvalinii]
MSIKLLDHKVMRSFIIFNSDLIDFFSNIERVEDLPLSHDIIQPPDSSDGVYFIHYQFKYEPNEEDETDELKELAVVDMFFRFEVLGENAKKTLDDCVPSICYPYMRSFLSTLFANSGVEPIYLPLWFYKQD